MENMKFDETTKAALMKMLLEVPRDLVRKRIKLRESHLNNLLGSMEMLQQPKLKIKNGYVNINGKYNQSFLSFHYNQNVILGDKIKDKVLKLKVVNVKHLDSNGNNTFLINLKDINGFNKYLEYYKNLKILQELTIDSIDIHKNRLVVASVDKISVTVEQDYINQLIREQLINKYGLEELHITLEEGFMNIRGCMIQEQFKVDFCKNIRIKEVDLYKNEWIILELDENKQSEDKIGITLFLDEMIKMKSKTLQFLINRIIMSKKNKIVCDEKEKGIIVYY